MVSESLVPPGHCAHSTVSALYGTVHRAEYLAYCGEKTREAILAALGEASVAATAKYVRAVSDVFARVVVVFCWRMPARFSRRCCVVRSLGRA